MIRQLQAAKWVVARRRALGHLRRASRLTTSLLTALLAFAFKILQQGMKNELPPMLLQRLESCQSIARVFLCSASTSSFSGLHALRFRDLANRSCLSLFRCHWATCCLLCSDDTSSLLRGQCFLLTPASSLDQVCPSSGSLFLSMMCPVGKALDPQSTPSSPQPLIG